MNDEEPDEDVVRKLAREQWHTDGECEIDYNATVSYGGDNGAYVQAWVWVSFADTQWDKDKLPEG
jgi:hypothetical protein